jgi:hypothetical protein
VNVPWPGFWAVDAGHDLLENPEVAIRAAMQKVTITTRLEPLDDSGSHQDKGLLAVQKHLFFSLLHPCFS